jgi:guanylate kinase
VSDIQNKGKAIIFSAPSGAGKTTLVHHLLSRFSELEFSVSATSRAKRGQEKDGKDYYFLSPDEFKKHIDQNALIEWEEVYPNQFYGTLQSEIERIWSKGHHVIFDVDVVGGLNLKKHFDSKALAVFVQPPDEVELEKRLRGRGTESEEKIQMRLAKAKKELTFAPQFDYILVNENLESAFSEARSLVKKFIEL